MPSRNTRKVYIPESYYHVYNRGVNKTAIYLDDYDYSVFLNLLKRHLQSEPQKDSYGRRYVWLHGKLELLTYCLMPNHFHLLVYQEASETSMSQLMQAVCASYTKYFNNRYNRIGPLFQNRYMASLIDNEPYLQHISRYIHRNPAKYLDWQYSSLAYYLGHKKADWIRPQRIMDLFGTATKYLAFIKDYDWQSKGEDFNHKLANR